MPPKTVRCNTVGQLKLFNPHPSPRMISYNSLRYQKMHSMEYRTKAI